MSEDDDLGVVSASSGRRRAVPEPPSDIGEVNELDRQLANELRTDYGNSQRMIRRFGDSLLRVENIGWFAWDGARWSRDGAADAAVKFAHRTALAIWREAKAVEAWRGKDGGSSEKASEKIEALKKWAVECGAHHKVNAMINSAAPYLARAVDELDARQFLLACPNGTVELGLHCEFRQSRRNDLLTRVCGVEYKTGTQCPNWHKFLERIIPDQDMRDFLQRVMGYCLTGSTREQCVFIFYGTGLNGKSTLLNVLRAVMGDYAMITPAATFLAKRDGGGSGSEASPDMARLPGARLVTAAEPPEGARLDEGRIKEITGGEPITTRHLNQGFFTYRPAFKAVISTNHQPTIRGADHGIWRRICMVPFKVAIPKDEIDRNLEEKLLGEGPAILQWMLTGVEQWLEMGLAPPAAAIKAVEDYRADQDSVGEFIKNCCVRTDDSEDPATGRAYAEKAADLYAVYKKWCRPEGIEPMSHRSFGIKLRARGLDGCRIDGHRQWKGIQIKATHKPAPELGAELAEHDR